MGGNIDRLLGHQRNTGGQHSADRQAPRSPASDTDRSNHTGHYYSRIVLISIKHVKRIPVCYVPGESGGGVDAYRGHRPVSVCAARLPRRNFMTWLSGPVNRREWRDQEDAGCLGIGRGQRFQSKQRSPCHGRDVSRHHSRRPMRLHRVVVLPETDYLLKARRRRATAHSPTRPKLQRTTVDGSGTRISASYWLSI